jgi:hypothetical protein
MFVTQPPIEVGSRPGRGTWRCLSCNWRVKLDTDWTALPPCGGECKKNPDVDESRVSYARIRGVQD